MINSDMRFYDYGLLEGKNAYGEQSAPDKPTGQVKLAIYESSQSIQDNINYKDCSYVGLTKDTVDDTYIIFYKNIKLKVLYVNSAGRYNQVFMAKI